MLGLDVPEPHVDVALAMRFIQNHADKPITVRDVLKEVPISRRHMEIQFRKLLGRSPRQQIQHAHVERAKLLSQDFDLSWAETAELSGFDDQTTFGRIFKRFEKCTPRQYRNRIRRLNGDEADK